MKQEQKPFEIKDEFYYSTHTVKIKEVIERCDEDLYAFYYRNKAVAAICNIAINANDEIRRLQGENDLLERANVTFNKCNDQLITENESLKQQLAAAPSWGEWVDAGNATEELVMNITEGEYKFLCKDLREIKVTVFVHEHQNSPEGIRLSGRRVNRTNWINYMDGNIERYERPVKFLSRYTPLKVQEIPKPAREVESTEKKYNLLGYHVTVAEMAEWRGNPDLNMPNIGELARDFLAVQAELRELKGER